jgi:DNA (cytosine-5)-methyltransferase 1
MVMLEHHGRPMRPCLLDLYCGAGGCSVGYHRAGFDVVGVDINPQPNYPFEFFQGEALEFLAEFDAFDAKCYAAIHASPPCQAYTHAKHLGNRGRTDHPDLVAATRKLLKASGLPYVIENVPGAPLIDPVMICGSSLGLPIQRHRLFETNWTLMVPPCQHGAWGAKQYASTPRADGSRPDSRIVNQMASGTSHAMLATAFGIDWIPDTGGRPADALRQAIPPAFCELIGHQLMAHIKVAA